MLNLSVRETMRKENSVMLQRDTLPMQVLNELMDWIMDGKLKMGEKLNTEELAKQLGVSRMPIREALSSLERMGLAESIPYVGTHLVTLTREDILQIYLMRQSLEPMVAYNACKKITDQDIKDLEIIHTEYIHIIKEKPLNAKRVHLQNRKFHFALFSISKMNRICDVIESLWDTLSFFKLIYGREFVKNTEDIDTMIAEHRSFIDFLRNRDADLLKKYFYDSLNSRIQDISIKSEFYTL